jgi:hypothetical protein
MNVTRGKLSVLGPEDDENVERHLTQAEKLQQITTEEDEKRKKLSPMVKCQAEFAKLASEVRAEAKVFTMTYGNNENECFDWDILGDQEYHIDCDFKPPDTSKVISSCFNFETSIQEIFFEHIFPSVAGHAKIIDKFLANPRAPFHETVKNHKIVFNDTDNDDPDWKVFSNLIFYFLLFSVSLF